MKTRAIVLALCACVLSGCRQFATVTEVSPRAPGLEASAGGSVASLGLQIAAAENAWRRFDQNPSDAVAQRDYNFAVSRIFGTLRDAELTPWTAPIKTVGHTLSWQRHPDPVWNPAAYELIPTDRLTIGGSAFDVRETKPGIGAPLVAKRVDGQVHEYAPTPHYYYCATGLARFEGSRCVLSIEDPLKAETVRIGGRTVPLAAGYSAPLAMMAEEMHPGKMGVPRLLHPAKFADTTRIARLEPFDPNKTVVLVVHGLMSSPATWLPLINHLRADEDIRRNYQFWLFSYPTGYPYSYSAALLRNELDQAEKHFPMKKKMVVIGHSMGGCISRLLITDSDRRIWDQMFTVPPEKMDIPPEHRHILTESTIFRHRPEIGRVIFISSPLRGADLAGGWLGRIGSRLVKLPGDLLSIGSEDARYGRNAAGHKHLDRFPDSVDTLAPDNDFVRALDKVPLTSGIPYHTICGDRGKGDAPNSSDGLVPYWSSHLPKAKSEKIVPSHHNAQQHPEGIREVHRILALHSKSGQ
jgi:pimeloyl-ACP methyl ester carboxylesterase